MAIPAIMTSFLAVYGLTHDHRRLADRAVPGRADRPRRRDRLLAADRRALARGARARARGRRGDRARDGDGRPRRRLLRHDRRDRPARAVALPLPFLRSDRLRRHADPAHERRSSRSRCCRSCCTRPAAGSTGRTAAPTTAPRACWTRWARGVVQAPRVRRRHGAADPRRAASSPRRTCTSASPTSTRSPRRATRRTGSTALKDSGIGSGALLPARDARARRRVARRRSRPRSRGVDGIHGAVAPDGPGLARGRQRDRGRRSRRPTATSEAPRRWSTT